MKKLLSLVFAFMLCIPVAFADVLSDNWQDAPMEELQEAQKLIGDRISELRAASTSAGEAMEYHGSGTSIISGVKVTQIPCRVTVEGAVKATFSGGKYDHTFNAWQYAGSCEDLTEAATYDLLVEGEGDWKITIEPLKDGGTIELSGTGPYVSDFFDLSSAMIVHVKMDASNTDEWSASLYTKMGHQYSNIEAWGNETVVGDSLFSSPLTLEGDGIVKPTGSRTQYYWIIDVPLDAEWSISLK